MLLPVKHFIKYHLDRQRLLYTSLIVIFAGLAITLYWVALKETRASLSDEFLHREQVIARSGSQSISGFINLLGKSVALEAEDLSEDTTLTDKQENLNVFIDHWRDTPAAAILLGDKNGKVIAQANRSGVPETGALVTDRPYFIWAKTANKGKFNGVVSVAVILSDLTDYYITPIKISDNTRIFLFDQNGIVLSSLASNLVGTNYFDFLSGYSYPGLENIVSELRTAMVSSDSEGRLDVNLPDSLNPRSVGEFLVAYSKVKAGDNSWLLAIKSPKSESDIYLSRIKDIIYSALVFTIVLVIIFSITNLRAEIYRRKQGSS
jgi:hypothetical protein